MLAAVEDVYIDPLLKRWALELVRATRELERRGRRVGPRQPRARAHGARLGARRTAGRTSSPRTSSGSCARRRPSARAVGRRADRRDDRDESELVDDIVAACLERMPRPSPTGMRARRSTTGEPIARPASFPLVPQRRFVGVRFGGHRSPRRGARRRGRRHASVPSRRPAYVDRLACVGTAVRGARRGRVRRPRVLRRHALRASSSAIDSRPRMALYDSLVSVARQARPRSPRRVRLVARATAAERGDLAVRRERAVGRSGSPAARRPGRSSSSSRSEAL